MARRGQFGRLPRAVQSLTNTVVSIAQQMQNQRDTNLMDAWQKGGLFEGKPATDVLVLAHWKERLKGLSTDDPMYDQYQNAYIQTDYSIHESKESTLYAQGKISDGQMAQFYLTWAKKVPKDSEFYRVLQRDGAQFLRSAKTKSDAAAAKAKEDQYQADLKNEHDRNQSGGEYLLDVFTHMAAAGSPSSGIAPLIGATGSGQGLDNFDAGDPDSMLRLISMIDGGAARGTRGPSTSSSSGFGNANTILFYDNNNKPVTGADVMANLTKYDPKFDPKAGSLTLAYVQSQITRQNDSLQTQIDLATKTGHYSDAATLKDRQEQVAKVGREMAAWPVEKDYQAARNAYMAVVDDPSAAPKTIIAAWESYKSTLLTLSQDKRIAGDMNTQARLVAEANETDGSPTLAESFTGLQSGEASASSEIAKNKAHLDGLQEQIDLVNDPASGYVWTQGVVDRTTGAFKAQRGGSAVGAATIDEVKALDPKGNPQVVYLPSGDGRTTMPFLVAGVDVNVTANDPVSGKVLAPTADSTVGQLFRMTINGQRVNVYGFDTPNGRRYTTDPPWDSSAIQRNADGAVTLDLSAKVPADTTGPEGGPIGNTGWAVVDKAPAYLNAAGTAMVPAKPGHFVFDPKNIALDPTRNAAGGSDPSYSFSLTLAAMMSPDIPDGRKALVTLTQDPTFHNQVDTEAHQAAGQTWTNGQWLAPDQAATDAKYHQYTLQAQLAVSSAPINDLVGFVVSGGKFWDKGTTNTLTTASHDASGNPVKPLPTDMLQGTPFQALGGIFKTGTNILKGAASLLPESNTPAIKTGQQITVPGYTPTPSATPTVSPTTGFVTGQQPLPGIGTQAAPKGQTPVNVTGAPSPTPGANLPGGARRPQPW